MELTADKIRELRDALPPDARMMREIYERAIALEQAERERDESRQQAEAWAQEARTQRETVREIYQLCTGATGEPGDWNGAEPVRAIIRQRDEARGLLREISDRLDDQAEACNETIASDDPDKVAAMRRLSDYELRIESHLRGESDE